MVAKETVVQSPSSFGPTNLTTTRLAANWAKVLRTDDPEKRTASWWAVSQERDTKCRNLQGRVTGMDLRLAHHKPHSTELPHAWRRKPQRANRPATTGLLRSLQYPERRGLGRRTQV